MGNSSSKFSTLVFLRKDDHVLLGLKKRGFGEGKWNGIGGKPDRDESILDAAKRELQEEIGVVAKELEHVAKLSFSFDANADWNQTVYVFIVNSWIGQPVETEEMHPQWFTIDSIPFDSMWEDDAYWLPPVLEGKKITGDFQFNADQKLSSHRVDETEILLLE